MPRILQLLKVLTNEPEVPAVPGVSLRTFRKPEDIAEWLELRRLAFAGETPGAGEWSEAHFRQEFTSKWWWRPEGMWFAVASDSGAEVPVGTITLAMRGEPGAAVPVVHWLAVLPEFRGHGVGRLLLAMLEREVWRRELREIRLETHAGWQSAVRFYQAAGYQPLTLG